MQQEVREGCSRQSVRLSANASCEDCVGHVGHRRCVAADETTISGVRLLGFSVGKEDGGWTSGGSIATMWMRGGVVDASASAGEGADAADVVDCVLWMLIRLTVGTFERDVDEEVRVDADERVDAAGSAKSVRP